MTNRLVTAAAWGVGLLVAANASAQGTKRAEPATRTTDHPTHTIRGELAAVSVIGETMMDYHAGRAVIADFTYLTILGSPDNDKDRDKSRDDDKDKTRSGKDDGGKNGSDDRSEKGRRMVYQIAIGPETQVRDRTKNENADTSKPTTREQSQAALERLQLGDRVEVEFVRYGEPLVRPGQAQNPSASHNRHGRHRIIRGGASTVTILAAPDRDDNASSEKRSSSDSKDRSSDNKN